MDSVLFFRRCLETEGTVHSTRPFFLEAAKRSRHLDASSVTLARAARDTRAVDAMSSREDTASSEAQPHACPRLCTPLEGLRAWDRLGGFSYAFLDDTTRRELARLDARALAHRVALARDGLLELLREQDIRASPWTEDVVRHASDVSDASESAPCESRATTRRDTSRREYPARGRTPIERTRG